MQFIDAQKALCRKLNIDFTDIANNALFTLEDIKEYVNQGGRQAHDFDFWDFAEHSKTATLQGADITAGYVAYPNQILPSSIYYVTIGGKEYDKKNFQSFKKWFQENATDKSKYWAEFKRLIFFNVNACSAGDTIDIYGKRGFTKLVNDSDLLPFSPDTDIEDMSGNQAIIYLAYGEALASEKKKNAAQAEEERKKAYDILNILKGNIKQGRAIEQSKNRPMFNVGNMFGSGNVGSSEVGTFNSF